MFNLSQDNFAIEVAKRWIKDVVVRYNFCPFAAQVVDNDAIRYQNIDSRNKKMCLEQFVSELQLLDENSSIETTLMIFSQGLADFFDYLDFLQLAEEKLVELEYEGRYQLASFHPNYIFDGCDYDAAENYTNRSPLPIIHILRESSIEAALEGYIEPESIPERNIQCANRLGARHLQNILLKCTEVS